MSLVRTASRLAGALILALGSVTAAWSATQTFELQATVVGGAYAGQVGTGTFSFDPSLVTGTGTEIVDTSVNGGSDGKLTITFTFLGQTYTEVNDYQFPSSPGLVLVDGFPAGLDFLIRDGLNGVAFAQPNILSAWVLGALTPDPQSEVFLVNMTVLTDGTVPEPLSITLVGASLLGLALVRRMRPAR